MDLHDLTRGLHQKNDSKIVMLVADGLGGLPLEAGGHTELETAHTPNLDALARRGVSGLSIPVKPGITPGSGPGHLALFGYDPLKYVIGRGALEATGIGLELGPNDVAARGNFCTLDSAGNISDRRAGRISSEESAPLAMALREVKIPGVEVLVEPVKEHRFVVVFRGPRLGGNVLDTDPQRTGVPPLPPRPVDDRSRRTAKIAAEFLSQAHDLLGGASNPRRPSSRRPKEAKKRGSATPLASRTRVKKSTFINETKANGLTLRGFSRRPDVPPYQEVYGLRAAAIAVYPMYKGLARLVGMEIVGKAQTLDEQLELLKQHWADFDFFFLHYKYTDSTGEDGNFQAKVQRIEELDAAMPRITALGPDVLIVTGDHSTPSTLKSHSWHPVPTLLVADTCRYDGSQAFTERDCLRGGLGQFEAMYLMPLALAHAQRLGKFGA